MDDLYEISQHLIGKNRLEESVNILLDMVAIDRNWKDRAAQKLLTDVFKKLGSTNEIAMQGRKKLSKLLF